MMDEAERVQVLRRMSETIRRFYGEAVQIGNHPFVEFAGVMTAYLNSCRAAHEAGIDFSECSVHAGRELPMEQFEVAYLGEKLECIFTGRVAAIRDRDVCGTGALDSVGLAGGAHDGVSTGAVVAKLKLADGSVLRLVGLMEGQMRELESRVGEEVAVLVVGAGRRDRGLEGRGRH